ncbi:universal stress protein [Desulfobacter curvatus]|uniref:universal stress protein n=1 Tax=Desulfobacter curvatus TaxID=2290 RepID=UPI00035E391E|nr:universal stress protein [Desulfobacter curvatus]
MTTRRILVPSNFMTNDDKSLLFVIQKYSHNKNVRVTLFHAYTPVPKIEVRNNPIMEKMSGNLSYLKQFQKAKEEELQKAKDKLVKGGFAGSQVDYIFTPLKNDIAIDIIKLVQEKKFNVVVMNRNPNKIAKFFIRSVSKKVSDGLKGAADVYVLN